jgi:hypothetical protein
LNLSESSFAKINATGVRELNKIEPLLSNQAVPSQPLLSTGISQRVPQLHPPAKYFITTNNFTPTRTKDCLHIYIYMDEAKEKVLIVYRP